jgi:hypothetical protein
VTLAIVRWPRLVSCPSSRLCCDRDIVADVNDLHSRLVDLRRMSHIVAQFHNKGNLLGDFIRQVDKLKVKVDDVVRASLEMPRDAELLEARSNMNVVNNCTRTLVLLV